MSLDLRQVVNLLPVPTDPDPNTVEPLPSRVIEVPSRFSSSTSEGYQLGALLKDGASIDVTAWTKSLELSTWVRLTTPKTVLALTIALVDGLPGGSDVFLQMTNPVGGPTVIGFILL